MIRKQFAEKHFRFSNMENVCELCERERELTFHHLIPKKMHKVGYVRKKFNEINLNNYGLQLCKDCIS